MYARYGNYPIATFDSTRCHIGAAAAAGAVSYERPRYGFFPISHRLNHEAANAAKLNGIAEKEKAEPGKRAANVAAFEKKRQESERREAERTKRQAEREADNK